MDANIERARPDDGAAIVQLLEQNGLPVDGVLDHLNTALVARSGDRIVGTAALEIYPDGALLRSVAVHAAVRGCGVGRQLTQSALDLAATLDVSAVYLLTTSAERFFPRFGFTRIAREQVAATVQESVEFRSACPSTAVVMRKLLEPRNPKTSE
jgi:amino-acid N-acetyltransferase